MSEIEGLRAQILANAKVLLKINSPDDIDLIVCGRSTYTAVILVNSHPAIEGAECTTPVIALRELLLGTAELLRGFTTTRIGPLKRDIDIGGAFDEDMINMEDYD